MNGGEEGAVVAVFVGEEAAHRVQRVGLRGTQIAGCYARRTRPVFDVVQQLCQTIIRNTRWVGGGHALAFWL